ncbi:MAG: SH3 domain-containing protein [Pseudomonadota bacterium]
MLCLLWPFHPTAAATLYVTDRVAAEMYPAPRAAGKPMLLLPTGTTLQVLLQQKDFVRVRTADGSEGWVQRQQLQEDVPAQVLLLSLAQQHERTVKELDSARRQLAEQTRAAQQSHQMSRSWWMFFAVLVSLVTGFILGIMWLDWRIRERHGGFRL